MNAKLDVKLLSFLLSLLGMSLAGALYIERSFSTFVSKQTYNTEMNSFRGSVNNLYNINCKIAIKLKINDAEEICIQTRP